ncbi:hypothetical protein [Petrachloros mirabilis]
MGQFDSNVLGQFNVIVRGAAVSYAVVPLPGTFWPFALGFLALVGYEWRQWRQAGLQVG